MSVPAGRSRGARRSRRCESSRRVGAKERARTPSRSVGRRTRPPCRSSLGDDGERDRACRSPPDSRGRREARRLGWGTGRSCGARTEVRWRRIDRIDRLLLEALRRIAAIRSRSTTRWGSESAFPVQKPRCSSAPPCKRRSTSPGQPRGAVPPWARTAHCNADTDVCRRSRSSASRNRHANRRRFSGAVPRSGTRQSHTSPRFNHHRSELPRQEGNACLIARMRSQGNL